MPRKRKIILIVTTVMAAVLIAVAIGVPCGMYDNGYLGGANNLIKAKDGQIRVACVGDSLTYGFGISGWARNNYPKQLGNMLGDGYCVNNYGYSGRTASFSGDRPYVNEKLYTQSLNFAPEIVIIMLGSNDTKPENWKNKDAYLADYEKIIKSYLELESVKEVYIMSPTPVFKVDGKEPYNINTEIVANEIYHTARELAEKLNLNYIDLFTIFKDRAELFKDGAHPNAEGAKIIAETVRAAFFGE